MQVPDGRRGRAALLDISTLKKITQKIKVGAEQYVCVCFFFRLEKKAQQKWSSIRKVPLKFRLIVFAAGIGYYTHKRCKCWFH